MAVYHKHLKYHEDDITKHSLSDEERRFLSELQKELNTQDDVGQANPRFWVIKGSEKLYHVDEADGFELYDKDACEVIAGSMKDICEYINENLLEEINENRLEKEKYTVTFETLLGYDTICVSWTDEDGDEQRTGLSDLNDIQDWLSDNGYDYQVISYKIIPKIYENTMFLTQKDAEEHLRANYYHYSNDAHTYAMTSWRSPRIERLVDILQKVDWLNVVHDDMCECVLLNGHQFLHETSCGDVFDMQNGFKYCPYCGKKIKVVDDYKILN